ncbi:hypothetical protein [Pectobacterium sp. A5351]|uniref:hypothetical protein n=1 Tax=Pectobacterium sp. A5351 TaxID=2914983 RepID=UPI00232B1DDF|nr:hypothetical protein [Pectobacterium sp. A5351]WCG83731.1 hypothetical protein O1Q74_03265 [Pectobacterium sp. A5351]
MNAPLKDSVNSARIFNEPYFALQATLPRDSLQYRFGLMLKILAGYINDEPATRFVVDMQGNFVMV